MAAERRLIGLTAAPRAAACSAFERLEARTFLSVAHGGHHRAHEADVFWYVAPGDAEPVEQTPRFVPTEFKWSQPGGLGTPVPLTYSYSNLLNGVLPGGLTAAQLTDAIEEAMQVWAAVAPLRFTQQVDPGNAPTDATAPPPPSNPQIRWGHHPIDGASGTNALAHAYFPPGPGSSGLAGDVHFDRDNTFALNPFGAAIDVIETATHEFGHAIGLAHEPTPANGGQPAIMNPIYAGRFSGPGTAYLLADDIAGIQSRYGAGFGYVLDLDGTLNLSGTEAANTFTLNISGGNITATSTGFGTFTIPAAGVTGIVINGRGGSDTFNIDASNLPVTLNGAAGDDTVTIGPAATALPAFRYIGGAGNDALTVNGGGVTFAADAVNDTANLTLNVNTDNAGAANVTLGATQHLAGLNLGAGAIVTMTANGNRYLYTKGLSINATAKLDLNDNDLLLTYSGGSPYLNVRNWIDTGRNTGIGGITSTTGAAAGDRVHAPVDNAIYHQTMWMGQPIDDQTIIAKYTYYGDANLSGSVTSDDYVAVDVNLGIGNGTRQWIHGDFNINGVVSSDDYVAIDVNLGKGNVTPLAAAEPAALTVEMTSLESAPAATSTHPETTEVTLVDSVSTRRTKPAVKRLTQRSVATK